MDQSLQSSRCGRADCQKATRPDAHHHRSAGPELAQLIDQPEKAKRDFWTAKAFHGYIGEAYQIQCSDETVVRFFHKQGFALKTPQPWSDMQDEQLRESFLAELQQLFERPDVDIWFAHESGFEGDPRPRKPRL